MFRQEKGITLIALVITIIVLLILAGVVIAMLTGENGILTRSSESRVVSEIGDAKDIVSLAAQEAVTEYYHEVYVNNTSGTTYSQGAAVTRAEAAITAKQGTLNQVTLSAITDHSFTLTSQRDTTKVATGTINPTTGALTWSNSWE